MASPPPPRRSAPIKPTQETNRHQRRSIVDIDEFDDDHKCVHNGQAALTVSADLARARTTAVATSSYGHLEHSTSDHRHTTSNGVDHRVEPPARGSNADAEARVDFNLDRREAEENDTSRTAITAALSANTGEEDDEPVIIKTETKKRRLMREVGGVRPLVSR
jgi:hypothetical protein